MYNWNVGILALNTISGKTALITEKQFNHPVYGKHLVAVDEAKDYVEGMYAPKTADEFNEAKRTRSKKTEPAPVVENDAPAEGGDD